MAEIQLKIVTPTKTVFEGDVLHYTAPGALGQFEVLRNHAPIVSKLVAGLLKFTLPNNTEEHYYVAGGFLEHHKNQGVVLADAAEHSSAIDVAEIERQRTELQRKFSDHEIHHQEFHTGLDLLNAKLAVAKA
jgi:F-type H+-transporting ATPase subunit epsilon